MRKIVLLSMLVLVGLSSMAQGHDINKESIKMAAPDDNNVTIQEKEKPRHTGASRRYKYTVKQIELDASEAMDTKVTISVSSSNHKLQIKVEENNGGMTYMLVSEEGTQLTENWWTNNKTTIPFAQYGEGNYYLSIVDALGKKANFMIIKKLN